MMKSHSPPVSTVPPLVGVGADPPDNSSWTAFKWLGSGLKDVIVAQGSAASMRAKTVTVVVMRLAEVWADALRSAQECRLYSSPNHCCLRFLPCRLSAV